MSRNSGSALKKPVAFVAAALLAALGTFQNCSDVEFQTSAPSVLDDNNPFEAAMVTITAGLREVPPLKMVFVVDNSYTMKANQLNLSRSFGRMFDPANSRSLAPFAVSSFLLNTAQKIPGHGAPEIAQIDQLQLTAPELENLAFSTFLSTHRGTYNSGALPGDILGYSTALSANPAMADFLPAPVLGAQAGPDGKVKLSASMHKAANENADAFAAEFQARVALLDNARIQPLPDGSQKFSSILDSESGMCAMARVLRNNAAYFDSSEIAAFVVVSDEDEADINGASCVQRHSTWTGTEPLVKGNCEHRRTVVSYDVRTADSCNIAYQRGYRFRYSWTQPVTTHAYPRTTIGYSISQTNYRLISTQVRYYTVTTQPVFRDGIQVGTTQVYSSLLTATREGDFTANCGAVAQSISANAALDTAHSPVCTRTEPTVSSCSPTNPNCIVTVTYPTRTTTVAGSYATGPACTDRARSISGAITDGSRPVTCTAASNGTGNGACPTNLIALGCTSATTNSTANATGSISFGNSGDGGSTLAVGDCGPVRNAIYNQVRASNPGAADGGTCAITGYDTGSASQAVTPEGCAAQAATYCAQNSQTARACTGSAVAGTAARTNLPAVNEAVSCASNCGSTRVNFCPAVAGVTVTSDMTIEQYFKARYGADTTCQAAVSVAARQPFNDRLESAMDQICVTAPYYYYVQDGPAYYKTGPAIEHVAGSVVDSTGKYVPAKTLPEYIVSRSREIFGEANPFVSMFVRRSTDPAGTQGSAGVKYETLAALMSGRTNSILSEDFSPALQDLSGVIKDRLQRSFTISAMKPHQRVRNAWKLGADGRTWEPLDKSSWTASGRTVTLSAAVDFNVDDQFRFEYW